MIIVKGFVCCEQWSQDRSQPSGCTAAPIEMEFDATEDVAASRIIEQASAAGFIADPEGTRFYCSRHDPASAGTKYEITSDYVEVAPGVLVRPAQPEWRPFGIEVKAEAPPKPKRWQFNIDTQANPYMTRLSFEVLYNDEDAERGEAWILRVLGVGGTDEQS